MPFTISQYRHALTIYDKAPKIEPGNINILNYNIEALDELPAQTINK